MNILNRKNNFRYHTNFASKMLIDLLYKKIAGSRHPRIISTRGAVLELTHRLWTSLYIDTFRRTQYLSPETLKSIFESRLVKLIKIVRADIPFYRDYYENVEKLEDFWMLPVMTKDFLRLQYDKGTIISPSKIKHAIKRRTTGSTGVPLCLYIDANARSRRIAQYQLMLESMGKKDNDSTLLLMTIPDGFIESEVVFFKCGSVEDVESKFEEICTILEERQMLVQSRPSFLVRLAQLVEAQSRRIQCKAIISYSEELSDEVRQYLSSVFQTHIYNYYASNEVNLIGYECEYHDGVHVNNCWTYTEVVDAAGTPLPPGKIGDVIVTSLDNEVMPFIRYQTGDRGYLVSGDCKCGRTLPRIRFEGRKFSAFLLPNGRAGYAWMLLKPITARISRILKYQAIRHNRLTFEIKIVPHKNFTNSDKLDIESKIKEYLGPRATISFHFVDAIGPTPGGKQQPFINYAEDFLELRDTM